jgi:hypothetical protein
MGSSGDEATNLGEEICDMQQAFTALHIPYRPRLPSQHPKQKGKLPHEPQDNRDKLEQTPSIMILVCADFDLESAAALAEYTIVQKNQIFDANAIDLIIAVGSCSREAELSHYFQGNNIHNQFRHKIRRRKQCRNVTEQHLRDTDNCVHPGGFSSPFFRSREESATLEGLMTAALSQLESIVCRVVYCPGWQDPLTVLQPKAIKRLTPNSRNIHQQWLPIAPGLGCAGLFYLDRADKLVESYKIDSCAINNSSYNDEGNNNDSESSEKQDDSAVLSNQLKKLKQLYVWIVCIRFYSLF